MTDYLDVAVAAARRAGALQCEAWRKPRAVREVTRHDIKLQLDVECEEAIRDTIARACPDHAFLGEEGGGAIVPEVPTWVIDPLDGTVNYTRGLPHFCSSIALVHEGRTLVGVVYDPLVGELFTAREGQGACLNGEPMRVSETAALASANIGVGFSKSMESIARMLNEINDMAHLVHKVRIMGAAALDLAYVAAGRFDGFIEYRLRSWDITAGALMVREAGGRVTLCEVAPHTWDVRADNGRLL